MLQDEKCNFLCADFDDGSFEKDIIAFKEACEESGIPVSIERSRSGNGAHAWIFFDFFDFYSVLLKCRKTGFLFRLFYSILEILFLKIPSNPLDIQNVPRGEISSPRGTLWFFAVYSVLQTPSSSTVGV